MSCPRGRVSSDTAVRLSSVSENMTVESERGFLIAEGDSLLLLLHSVWQTLLSKQAVRGTFGSDI